MTIAVEMAFEGGAGTLVADGCPEFGIAFVWYVIEIFIGQCAASAVAGSYPGVRLMSVMRM